ncbi:MAG TPA: aldo/keto reductase [Polyangiaceae bacterium]|jgi:aryl-alcohol dehydrogenase-like predicted oxidoreductase|nr:aldo/keto reductase [Polyangiaceae bacterium]
MRLNAFGKTDLKVSEFGFGCARIGGVFQGDPQSFVRLLAVARDGGINFFDTSDLYSQGESEALLGRVFGKRRSEVIITTKAGYCMPGRRKLAGRLKPILRPVIKALGIRRDRLPAAARGALAQDFSAAYLTRAVEASLVRLRTDYVDLLQLHSPPADVVERGEWEPALEDLKRAGKLRYYGISCDTPEAARAALRFPNVSSLQFAFNLLEPGALETILPSARETGVACIARECLGNGLLVKPNAHALDLSSYCSSPEQAAKRKEQLLELEARAAERGVSIVEMALEFTSRTPGISVSLLGARTPQQLRRLLDTVPA